jgi:hypothetical protein
LIKQLIKKKIKIYYSNHKELQLKNPKNMTPDEEKKYCEQLYIGSPADFRFNNTKSISINPPSSTLHISSLKKEYNNENFLTELVAPFVKPEAIK